MGLLCRHCLHAMCITARLLAGCRVTGFGAAERASQEADHDASGWKMLTSTATAAHASMSSASNLSGMLNLPSHTYISLHAGSTKAM